MIKTFDNRPKGSFANLFNDFKSIADLIASFESIVAFLVVKSVIHKSFKLGRLIFLILSGQVPNFVKFFDFSPLEGRQHFVREV